MRRRFLRTPEPELHVPHEALVFFMPIDNLSLPFFDTQRMLLQNPVTAKIMQKHSETENTIQDAFDVLISP